MPCWKILQDSVRWQDFVGHTIFQDFVQVPARSCKQPGLTLNKGLTKYLQHHATIPDNTDGWSSDHNDVVADSQVPPSRNSRVVAKWTLQSGQPYETIRDAL